MSSIKLPYDLKKLVLSYLETPSAYAIKGEITRILPLIEQNKLTESQTLWSIRKIYWHETTNIKKYLFYIQKNWKDPNGLAQKKLKNIFSMETNLSS